MSASQLRRAGAVLLSCMSCAMLPAHAQNYPVKPIRIILPFATGGTNLVARWLGIQLAPVIGQQVVPDPRPGAGGTPREIIDRLNAETVKIMRSPETRERFSALGGEPATSTPEQTAEFLRAEYARWGKVIRDAGIKAERGVGFHAAAC